VFKGVSPSVLKGVEEFTEVELNVAAVLYERLRGGPDFAALVVDTIREVDFLLAEGAVIYHVEVKTTMNPTDVKLRKKRMLLQKRQNVLEKLGLRPALAVVVPKENWEVEVWIEKTTF
jgi:predicted AAA+ superfamily ATPase